MSEIDKMMEAQDVIEAARHAERQARFIKMLDAYDWELLERFSSLKRGEQWSEVGTQSNLFRLEGAGFIKTEIGAFCDYGAFCGYRAFESITRTGRRYSTAEKRADLESAEIAKAAKRGKQAERKPTRL